MTKREVRDGLQLASTSAATEILETLGFMTAQKRRFTYEEAIDLLPEVQKITGEAVKELEMVLSTESAAASIEVPPELIREYERVVSGWAESMLRLGTEVKGLWLVDFDSGSGYYCWRYPEPSLQYFHDYDAGFSGRVKLN
ncbi:MAG: DUF2203 family protein [Thermoanaerobaculia bacterium]